MERALALMETRGGRYVRGESVLKPGAEEVQYYDDGYGR